MSSTREPRRARRRLRRRDAIGGVGSYYAGIDVDNGPLSTITVTRNNVANGVGSRTAPSSGIRLHTAVTGLTLQANAVCNAPHGLRCDVLPVAPNFAPNSMSGVATPYTGCLAAPDVSSPETLRPTGGDPVLVTGEDFGATATEFRSRKITATIGGRAAALTWVNPTTLRAVTGPGAVGVQPRLVLARAGVTAPAVELPGRYAATIVSGTAAVSW